MLFPWPRLLCTVYTRCCPLLSFSTRCSPLLSFSTWQMQRVASTESLTLTLYAAELRKHRFTQDPSRPCAHAEACWANLWVLLMLLLKIFIYLLQNIYALNDMWWDTLNLLVAQGQKRMSSSPWPPLGAMNDFLLCATTWVTPFSTLCSDFSPPAYTCFHPYWVSTLHDWVLKESHGIVFSSYICCHVWTWPILGAPQIPVEWMRGRGRDIWSSLFIRCNVMDVTMCAGSWGNWSKVKATLDFWDKLHLDKMSFAYFWIWCL